MDDLTINELDFARNEKAIEETDKNMESCVIVWRIIFCSMMKIPRNV